ncbi:MAG: DEAD/DEAH box helicase [Ignavibacteriales bacterium]|nr:DEAD/DEAH box helicase [Ignavibacteriales bacterium]
MSKYINLDELDQFVELKSFSRDKVTAELIATVRSFQEEDDLEKIILSMIFEPNLTPHGPIEMVDILTTQLSYKGRYGLAGIILKGSSFKTIKASTISHQVFRLRKIADIKFTILGYVGNILDNAKDEFIQTAVDLNITYSFIDVIDFVRLAVISGYLCPRDAKRINNGKCLCGYRVKGNELNFLQIDSLKKLQEARELKQFSGLVVLPTGVGKTRVAAIDSKNCGAKKILYVAHTNEILQNAHQEFSHIYGESNVFYSLNEKNNSNFPVVHLETIQTISRNIPTVFSNNYDYVVIDEFHHAAANSYRSLIDSISPNFMLGLTATPFRGDRQDVIGLCNGNIIVEYELRTGIDSGILSPFHYYGLFDDVDYTNIRRFNDHYSIKDLDKVLIIESRDSAIISKWYQYADNLPTLAFCCSINHAKRVAESFNKYGVASEIYVGTTSLDVRNKLIEAFRYGDLKLLCVVDVMNEGIDIPFVECLLFLRPTESKRIFFQQLGRGLRKFPGKDKVVVLDFIGNFSNAYRIVDYIGLLPFEEPTYSDLRKIRTSKEILNVPLNCKVNFDSRVIDVFARQVFNPSHANRHNIAQILLYEYHKLSGRLGRFATKREVDRYQILNSELYVLVFGSWKNFESLIDNEGLLT